MGNQLFCGPEIRRGIMVKKIVIVDDEEHIRFLIEELLDDLEGEDIEVLTADNGADGLELIKLEKPNLVFLDVMIPRMNGFDVCRAVKGELGMKDVYIVILTAKGQELDKEMAREVGADIYVNKPFDPDTLLELAEKILG